jgi:Family of unknown function (DUF6884)
VLSPYDVTLKTSSRAQRRAWSYRVLADLDERVSLSQGDVVEIHAGSEYRDFGLVDGLHARGVIVKVPTAGLGLGRQLQVDKAARERSE